MSDSIRIGDRIYDAREITNLHQRVANAEESAKRAENKTLLAEQTSRKYKDKAERFNRLSDAIWDMVEEQVEDKLENY